MENEGQKYDLIAKGFADMRDSFATEQKYLDLFLEYLKPKSTILDVGCGSGFPIATYLIEKDFQVTGIELIATVYKNDESAIGLTKQQRLEYHQKHSAAIMNQLHEYITNQLDSKQVEPNDSLGKAMRYMLKHWYALTQFLRIVGAPLDNNI